MIWILKAVIQKTISYLPYKHNMNFLFQKYITKGIRLTDELFEDKLTHCKNHLYYFGKYNGKMNFHSLEIGTGWYPVLPLGMYLSGAEKVVSVDISDLLTTEAVHQTVQKFLDYHNTGKLNDFLKNISFERLYKMKSLLDKNASPLDLLKELNIEVIVGDARKINMPDGSFDLINSNNTFEHIYPEILADILKEFKRLSDSHAVMSHFIDMSDHFAHLDKSITVYNFLKFSDAQWAFIDNSIQPQNRLRISDYRKMYEQLQLKIVHEENRPGSVSEVQSTGINQKYSSYNLNDVAVTHSLIVSQ